MANFNFNKTILGGRLTADPELKTTPSGLSVTTFTLAVSRKTAKDGAQPKSDFINVTAWRQTAEFITRYFRKASSICVVGTLQNRTWTDQQGQKRYATEIVASEVHFVDSKSEVAGSAPAPTAQTQPAQTGGVYLPEAYQTTMSAPPDFSMLTGDEELPF